MARIGRIVRLSLVVLLLGFVVVPQWPAGRAHGESGCAAAMLRGPYGMQASGWIGLPGAFVGRVVFDGESKLAGTLVSNVEGKIDPVDLTGTYTVRPDCTGSALVFSAHHNPPADHWHDLDLVFVDGGREALFIFGGAKSSPSGSPNPGHVQSGVLKPQ